MKRVVLWIEDGDTARGPDHVNIYKKLLEMFGDDGLDMLQSAKLTRGESEVTYELRMIITCPRVGSSSIIVEPMP